MTFFCIFSELKYYDKGYAHMLCVSECFTETEFKTCDCITLTQSFFPNDTLECATATMTMCQIDDVELLRKFFCLSYHKCV